MLSPLDFAAKNNYSALFTSSEEGPIDAGLTSTDQIFDDEEAPSA